MRQLDASISSSWLILGDLNSILSHQDRYNGSPVTDAETQDFVDLLDSTNLNELISIGHLYSWSNKGHASNRTLSRIERGLGKNCWLNQFNNVVAPYLHPGISDHSPLLVNCILESSSGGRPSEFGQHTIECILVHTLCSLLICKIKLVLLV